MNLKKAVAAVALTAATSVGGVVVSESTPVSAHGDACTNAPDSGPFWNFHDSCHRHDDCYARKPYGNSQWGRLRCDSNFYSNMRSSCSSRCAWYDPRRGWCNNAASIYGAAVVAAGWYYWD